MDLVCSLNLVEHCTLAEPAAVDLGGSEERMTTVASPESPAASAGQAVMLISDTLSSMIPLEQDHRDGRPTTEDPFSALADHS